MSVLFTVIYFIIVLTIVVFIHEFGHYYIAKKCGVKIVEFSIGMGPKIFGRKDKNGCEWKFCLLPLGGYVQMYGDENATSFNIYKENPTEDELKYSLMYKHPLKKIAVSLAGPFMNFILAIVLFCSVFSIKGKPIAEPIIYKVIKNSYAEKSGILPGDKIISVNGKKIDSFNDISFNLQYTGNDKKADIELIRNNKNVKIKAFYKRNEVFGIGSKNVKYSKMSFLNSLKQSIIDTFQFSYKTGMALFKMIIHQEGLKNVGGPIAIAKESAKAGEKGLWAFIYFIGLVSVMLGATNLIIIPPLDGGQAFVSFIEFIIRRRISNKIYKVLVIVGFGIVFCLMGLGFINDLFVNR